jgi:tetratricopeptide (TPR) repeat protein
MSDVGLKLREYGLWELAESVLQRTYTLALESFGEYNKQTASTIANLSLAKGNRGILSGTLGAKALRKKAIEIYKSILGECSAEVAECSFMLADVLYVQGESPLDNLFCSVFFISFLLMTEVLSFFFYAGHFKKALPLYEEAYRIRKQIFPAHSEEIAQSLVGLGLVKTCLSEREISEQHYKDALEIREKLLGKDHPKVASVCVNLGAFYKESGRLELTIPLYRRLIFFFWVFFFSFLFERTLKLKLFLLLRALAIRESKLGREHPMTKKIRENLQKSMLEYEKKYETKFPG